MDISYQIILVGALLLLISIVATNFSSRIGMPILLLDFGQQGSLEPGGPL